jgi:hypothetical protein
MHKHKHKLYLNRLKRFCVTEYGGITSGARNRSYTCSTSDQILRRLSNSRGTTLETNSKKVRLVQPNVVARFGKCAASKGSKKMVRGC